MPGASIDESSNGDSINGKLVVKIGPIEANFLGNGEAIFDDASFSGIINGIGLDHRHNSKVRGTISFKLTNEQESSATRVAVNVSFALSGMLAQFSRTGIVNALADQLTENFSTNLIKVVKDIEVTGQPSLTELNSNQLMNLNFLLFQTFWKRFRSAIASIKRNFRS